MNYSLLFNLNLNLNSTVITFRNRMFGSVSNYIQEDGLFIVKCVIMVETISIND